MSSLFKKAPSLFHQVGLQLRLPTAAVPPHYLLLPSSDQPDSGSITKTMWELNADALCAIKPTDASDSSEDGISSVISEVTLENLNRCYTERYFMFHTERLMESYRAKDFAKVYTLALYLLANDELPMFHRVRCSFLLAGVYQDDGQSAVAAEVLEDCIHYCNIMVAIDVENKRQPPTTVTHLLIFAKIALAQARAACVSMTDSTISEADDEYSEDGEGVGNGFSCSLSTKETEIESDTESDAESLEAI